MRNSSTCPAYPGELNRRTEPCEKQPVSNCVLPASFMIEFEESAANLIYSFEKWIDLMRRRLFLRPGLVVERLGDDLVIMTRGSEVVSLGPEGADMLRRVELGEPVDTESNVVSELVKAGVLEPEKGLTRRSVVRFGAVASGVGVASLALPTAAAASSHSGGQGNDDAVLPEETPIEINAGLWTYFYNSGSDKTFLNFFAEVSGLEKAGSPSSLVVDGLDDPIPFDSVDTTNPPDVVLFWVVELGTGDLTGSTGLSGNVVAEFTWDDHPFEGLFEDTNF